MYLAIWRQDVRVASISLRLHPVIDPVDGTERGSWFRKGLALQSKTLRNTGTWE